MKKKLTIGTILLSSLFFTGCTTQTSSNQEQSMVLEQNQQKLIDAVPVPQVDSSSDRKSIARRAETFGNENKISYVYLVSYGKVMAFYTITGKVVSIKSYLTPQEQIVDSRGVPCDGYCSSGNGYIVQAPDIDGTFGDNAEAVFFYTTDGAYVEWSGEYMVSDQPLRLTTQPELVRKIE